MTQEAAALTGLRKARCVVGGAGDNAAAAVGTGIVREGKAFTTIGTSGVVYALSVRDLNRSQGQGAYALCCRYPGRGL